MIADNEFIKKLRAAFNLNIYEVKIWTALLSKGVATAGELADISNVPRSRSYDVLESLEKRGFVIMKLGKPIKYIAVEPKEIISRVKKDVQARANQSLSAIDHVSETKFYNELSVLFKNGIDHINPSDISGSIKGRVNLYDHMETMLKGAKKSVVIVTSKSGFKRKAEMFKPIFKKLSDKKIEVKIGVPLDKDTKKIALELGKYANVKNMNVDARFLMVDNKEMLFMINDDNEVHESYDIGVWINSPYFVNAMSSLFQSNWKK